MKKTALLVPVMALALTLTACQVEYADELTTPAEGDITEAKIQDSILRVRYCDESYSDYLEYCKKQYESTHQGVKVELELAAKSDYVRKIQEDSIAGEAVPDVYMAGNSELSVFYLAGLALKNNSEVFSEQNYSKAALDACSCKDSLVAYPLSFRTSVLVYNSDYLSENDVRTFEDIKTFSSNAEFNSEESGAVEKIFGCDLNSIFGNYGFIGDGIDLGGENGDDKESLSICNDNTLEAAQEYLSLVDYFHLDMDTSYEECLQKFSEGAMLATIVYTDDVASMADWQVNYKIAAVPDYNDKVKVTPLSVTKAMVVNPYSLKQKEAAEFAEFATAGNADSLYGYTMTMSARKGVSYSNAELNNVYGSYDKSVPQNKLLFGEQAYPRIEIALHNIVAGNDMGEELRNVDEYMKTQME